MLAAPSRAAGGTGGGKIVWYQRKLLRTAPNRFSSFFFFFGLVSDLSLPSVCWQTTAGPNPVLSCVSCRVPGVSLPAEAGRQAGERGREGGQVGPPPPAPARRCFPAAFRRAADYNPSARDWASARAGFPGICLDTYLGILGPAWEEESKVAVFIFYFYMCGVKRKGKTNLGLASDPFMRPQRHALRCHLPPHF